METPLDIERDIVDIIKQHKLKHILHLKITAIDAVNVLKLLAKDLRLIVVVLPPDGGDNLVFRIKDAFPNVTVITYRSFMLNNDDVLLAF